MSAGASDVRVFTYSEDELARTGVAIAPVLICAALALFKPSIGRDAVTWLVLLGPLALFGLVRFLRYRPLAISEERVASLIGGWAWRAIDWRDVDRIEKRIVPENANGEGGVGYELILVRSGRRTITVLSNIREYTALKQRLTEKAKRRSIALVTAEPQPLGRMQLTPLDEL